MRLHKLVAVLATVIVAGVLAGVAAAANPHFVPTSASFAGPTVNAPGNIHWDATVTVPFRLAGLGNNKGVSVALTANSNIQITQHGGDGTYNSDQGGTNNSFTLTGFNVNSLTLVISQHTETDTLSSDKNGNVNGALTLGASLDTLVTGGDECVTISWTNIKLTAGAVTATVPDVSRQYDSTGTACA